MVERSHTKEGEKSFGCGFGYGFESRLVHQFYRVWVLVIVVETQSRTEGAINSEMMNKR